MNPSTEEVLMNSSWQIDQIKKTFLKKPEILNSVRSLNKPILLQEKRNSSIKPN